jgi:hypothetical protein
VPRLRRNYRKVPILEKENGAHRPHAYSDVDKLAGKVRRVALPLAQALADTDGGKNVNVG